MRELSYGGGAASVMIRLGVIAILVWFAMWLGIAVLVIWALTHVIVTRPRARAGTGTGVSGRLVGIGSSPEAHFPTDWWSVAAALLLALGAAFGLWHAFAGGSGLTVIPGLAVALAARTRNGSRSRSTQWMVRTMTIYGAVMLAFALWMMWMLPEKPLMVSEPEMAGLASTIEDSWRVVPCLPGTQESTPDLRGQLVFDETVFVTVKSCILSDHEDAEETYYFQARSPEALDQILQDGRIVARSKSALQHADIYRDGAVLVVTWDGRSARILDDAQRHFVGDVWVHQLQKLIPDRSTD